MAEHARPARYASEWFDQFVGDVDPALRTQLAHDTADALLTRVRESESSAETEQVLLLPSGARPRGRHRLGR